MITVNNQILDPRYLRLAELLATGMSQTDAAREIGVCKLTVTRWMKRPEVRNAVACAARGSGIAVVNVVPDPAVVDRAQAELVDQLFADLRLLSAARRHGISRLQEALDGALAAERYGDFARLLALACDRTGLCARDATGAQERAPQARPTPEQIDEISRNMAAQMGLLPQGETR